MTKHNVFISYHHTNDEQYKDKLLEFNEENDIFYDRSIHCGDISDDLETESIRVKIRDEYLKDSTVTILLVGKKTKFRKYIDWEIYSSMRDSKKNKKSGILVINLPTIYDNSPGITIGHGDDELQSIYPNVPKSDLNQINSRIGYEEKYPYMPARIIDNLADGAMISVIPWKKIISNAEILRKEIDLAYNDREKFDYVFLREMRRRDSSKN